MLVVAVTILAILGVPLEKSNLLQAEPRYVAPKAPLKAVPAEVQHVAPKAPLKAVPAEVQRVAPKAPLKAIPAEVQRVAPKAPMKAVPAEVQRAAPKAPMKAVPAEVQRVAPKAPMKAVPAEVQRVAPKAPAERAEVLVIVSDHGSGTTDFGDALNTHPCMFDLGEPFANPTGLWSNSVVEGCQYPEAIFGQDSGRQLKNSNDQMTTRINHIARSKPVGMKPSKTLSGTDPSMYKDLKYNLGEYFVRARDLICANVPAEVCPPSDCTITVKMFPQWVNANTAAQDMPGTVESDCTIARNEKAIVAWKKELTEMKANPKVATLTMTRDPLSRQFSIFRRFASPGTKFDCGFKRAPDVFAAAAKDITDGLIQIEDCWADAVGANKCISHALRLVGLTPRPMGGNGTAILATEHSTIYDATSESCATNPSATFQRTDGGVHMLAPGGPFLEERDADVAIQRPE
jgi:hypothetical protein